MLFQIAIDVADETARVVEAAQKAGFKNYAHAGASIRKSARGRIHKDTKPSEPGEPPHTAGRGGHNLPGSIVFDFTAEDVEVGPRFSIVGEAGAAHELGGEFHDQQFDERPYMLPSLLENIPRFAESWQASIGA
jgi:hypothetical protein